jgi:hypothetical protein
MPEGLQNEEGTFNERIVAREVFVIPDALALERGEVNEESDGSEQKTAQPIFAQVEQNPI